MEAIDYAYYRDVYRGALDEAAFEAGLARALREIDRQTAGRARTAGEGMRENLRMCACELVDAIAAFGQVLPGVSAVGNDGVSICFTGAADAQEKSRREICARWLQEPENLMCRWI